jgi:hypothetical protein
VSRGGGGGSDDGGGGRGRGGVRWWQGRRRHVGRQIRWCQESRLGFPVLSEAGEFWRPPGLEGGRGFW